MPKVSLIIPIYNVACYLQRCINSIKKQTFKDFEAIFVNDGSTDESKDLCKKLIHDTPNMRLFCKENGGLTSAREYGFERAVGDYIVFIDSDDYLHPDYLKILYEAATMHHAEISMCSYSIVSGNQIHIKKLCFREGVTIIKRHEIVNSYILPQLKSIDCSDNWLPSFMWLRMYKREMITKEFFINERMVYQEDLASALTTYKKCNCIVVTNIPLYYYCINPGSLTLRYRENGWEMMYNLFTIIEQQTRNVSNSQINIRKKGFLLNAILFALRNASIKGFDEFRKVLKKIVSTEKVKSLFKETSFRKLHGQHKILAICFLLHITPLLYIYYKRSIR